MVKVKDQNIPAELKDKYDFTFTSSEWMPDDWQVRKRHPFRIPWLQGCRTIRPPIPRGEGVSDFMCSWRHVFGDCIRCWNKQPMNGGAEPAGYGPYSRTWWFTEAIGKLPWYFNYFTRETLNKYKAGAIVPWCVNWCTIATKVDSANPDTNYGGASDLHIGNYGHELWAYLKPPLIDLQAAYIWRGSWHGDGTQYESAVLGVYEVPDGFNENTLTWNNKPETGALISMRLLYRGRSNIFIRFGTGAKAAIMIKVIGGFPTNFDFVSDDYAVEERRPWFA